MLSGCGTLNMDWKMGSGGCLGRCMRVACKYKYGWPRHVCLLARGPCKDGLTDFSGSQYSPCEARMILHSHSAWGFPKSGDPVRTPNSMALITRTPTKRTIQFYRNSHVLLIRIKSKPALMSTPTPCDYRSPQPQIVWQKGPLQFIETAT